MTYTKQTWVNGPLGGTPISAERLSHIEDGIEAATAGTLGELYAPAPTGEAILDTANLQTAIDACITDGAVTTIRVAVKKLILGAGTYVVDSPLLIQSVQGFQMEGAGRDITRIKGTGTVDAVLAIDGCTDGRFGNFSINGTGVHDIDKCVSLQWSGPSAIGRSTSNCEFYNILVNECTYRSAFAIGTESANLQVDDTVIRDCIAFGGRLPRDGTTTTFQHGFEIGSGVSGNVLGTTLFNCSSAQNRYGILFNATNGYVFGSQPSHNEVDIRVIGASGPVVVDGMRSESAQRLYEGVGTSGAMTVTLRNILWVGDGIADDGKWIVHNKSGTFVVDNVTQNGITAAGTTDPLPIIEMTETTLGTSPLAATLIGVQQQSSISAGLSLGYGNDTSVEVINYSQLAAASGASVVKVTNRKSLLGSSWRKDGPDYLSTLGNNSMVANAIGSTVNTFVTANNALLVQVRPARDITLGILEWYTGGVSSGNYDIGVYNDIGQALYRKGSTAWPSINNAPAVTVTPSITLRAGLVYWIALAGDNTSGTFYGTSAFTFAGHQKEMAGTYLTHVVASSFPLPSTISVANTFGSKAPLIVIREVL